MKMQEAEELGRKVARRAAEKIKARREATAFANKHGRSHMFVNSIAKSSDPQFSRLALMADWLGMSMAELLEEVEMEEGDSESLKPPKRPPKVVSVALEALGENVPRLGNVFISDDLKAIDSERYENPVRVLLKLEELAGSLSKDQIPYALNVAASCYRMLFEFNQCSVCTETARDIALRSENDLAVGECLQRSVFLLSNLKMSRLALRRNQGAREIYIDNGAFEKMAETLVDRGYCLFQTQNYEASLNSYLMAGKLDSMISTRHRTAWRQTAALCLVSLGDLESAKTLCAEALELAKDSNPLLKGQALWAMGRIEGVGKNVDEAHRLFLAASSLMHNCSPADSVIATLELGTLLFRVGRFDDCSEVLEALSGYLEDFWNVVQVVEAIHNLVSLVKMRRLSIGAINACLGAVRNNRARLYWARAA